MISPLCSDFCMLAILAWFCLNSSIICGSIFFCVGGMCQRHDSDGGRVEGRTRREGIATMRMAAATIMSIIGFWNIPNRSKPCGGTKYWLRWRAASAIGYASAMRGGGSSGVAGMYGYTVGGREASAGTSTRSWGEGVNTWGAGAGRRIRT